MRWYHAIGFTALFLPFACTTSTDTDVGGDDTPHQVGSACKVSVHGTLDCDSTGLKILRCEDGHFWLETNCGTTGQTCEDYGDTAECVGGTVADDDEPEDGDEAVDDAEPRDDDIIPAQVSPGADCTGELEALGLTSAFGCSGDRIMICSSQTGNKWASFQDCSQSGRTCWVNGERTAAYCQGEATGDYDNPADDDASPDVDTVDVDEVEAEPDNDTPQPDADNPLTGDCVYFVDPDAAAATPDGLSWQTAFAMPQEAIDAAAAFLADYTSGRCEVWVAAGTYRLYESSSDDTLLLRDRVDLYGGFTGVETARTERDWAAHQTILRGTDAAGTAHVRHVVTAAAASTIDGFTITGGAATGTGAQTHGGGISAVDAAPTVRNCRIESNTAAGNGAGAYLLRSDAVIEESLFMNNAAQGDGGAIASSNGSPLINAVPFIGNSAVNGGALSATLGTAEVVNDLFFGNSATGQGGAIYSYQYASTVITNGSFSGNQAAEGGALYSGGTSHPVVTNAILWGDSSDDGKEIAGGAPSVSYSDVAGELFIGAGNISADPLFVDGPAGDLHLTDGSPCIDAAKGSIGGFTPPDTDSEGSGRHDVVTVADTGTGTPTFVDMGAYEFY